VVDLLAFVLLVLVIVGAPLVWLLLRSAPQPGTKQMVLLGGAAGEAELTSWASALRNAGIHPRVLNIGGTGYGPSTYYEVWVPARDEDKAREVLGL